MNRPAFASVTLLAAMNVLANDKPMPPSPEEMWAIIQSQQARIEQLEADRQTTIDQLQTTEHALSETSAAVEA